MTTPLIQIKNLNVTFRAGDQAISAVRNISLDITPGQNIALVGEDVPVRGAVCPAGRTLQIGHACDHVGQQGDTRWHDPRL